MHRADAESVHPKITAGDGLMAAHVFLAVTGTLFIFTRILGVAGCDDRCDYPTLEFATRGFWGLDLAVLLIALISYFLLRRRLRAAWIIPCVGVLITSSALVVAIVALNEALIVG